MIPNIMWASNAVLQKLAEDTRSFKALDRGERQVENNKGGFRGGRDS